MKERNKMICRKEESLKGRDGERYRDSNRERRERGGGGGVRKKDIQVKRK